MSTVSCLYLSPTGGVRGRKQPPWRCRRKLKLHRPYGILRRRRWSAVREQEMAPITRDYEMSETNYKSLLDKKMAAGMAFRHGEAAAGRTLIGDWAGARSFARVHRRVAAKRDPRRVGTERRYSGARAVAAVRNTGMLQSNRITSLASAIWPKQTSYWRFNNITWF